MRLIPVPATVDNLIRAEFTRLVARRFTQVMVLLLLGAFGITLFTTMASTHRPDAAEVQRAEQLAADQRFEVERIRRQCELAQQPDAPPELQFQFPRGIDCGTYDPDDVQAEDFLASVFSFASSIRDLVLVLTGFLGLFGFLVGASSVGAELSSGGMTNLLLWQPRRQQVLSVKLGTLLAGVTGLAVVATLLYLSAFWALAEVAGKPGEQGDGFWADLIMLCVRGNLLALMATALGFAIATVGRHTSAAVGLLAGYAVVWELGARLVMEIIGVGKASLWVLSSYIAAWLNGDLHQFGGGGSYTIRWWHSGLVFAALLATVVGGAFAHFRSRDLA